MSLTGGCELELLLLVAAQVGVQSAFTSELQEGSVNPTNLRVLQDPITPEQWFCVHDHAAYILSAPWLRMLSSRIASGKKSLLCEASTFYRQT